MIITITITAIKTTTTTITMIIMIKTNELLCAGSVSLSSSICGIFCELHPFFISQIHGNSKGLGRFKYVSLLAPPQTDIDLKNSQSLTSNMFEQDFSNKANSFSPLKKHLPLFDV
jgi:hypothetical protein